MKRVLRFDAGALQSPRRTSQGYLRVDGWASRVGIQEYRNPDGSIRRELREPDAVFSDASLSGFEGAPITDEHPSEMVDITNAKGLTKGTVLSVGRRDGDHVAVSMVITDPDLIAKMEKGKRQLSTGYYVELDETPGNHPQFGRYDARQVRVGPVNHLAVVERGRAGSARVRMDAAVDVRMDLASDLHDAKTVPHSDSTPMTLEEALARIKELEAQLAAAKGEDAAEGDAPTAKTDAADVATLEGERDVARKDAEDAKAAAAKATADAQAEVEKVRKDSEALLTKKVRESLDTLTKAKAVLGADAKIKLDGKDVDLLDAPLRAVKCAVIKHVDGDEIAAEKHDAYVEALFDRATKSYSKGAQSLAAARTVVEAPRADALPATSADPEKAAAEAHKNRISSAWKAEPENK